MWWNNIQKEKGVALYLAIVVLSLLLSIVFGLGSLFLDEIRLLRGIGHSVVALYAAEAGMEAVLYEDSLGNNILDCDGTGPQPPFCEGTFSNTASYVVVVDASGGSCGGTIYCIESAGLFQDAIRKIFIER